MTSLPNPYTPGFTTDDIGNYYNDPAKWQQQNTIDPNTGLLVGPSPLPPADMARVYQALHDRGVWLYRQRLMQMGIGRLQQGNQSAQRYMQGALGLLQSYRAGGSAALEAGIYNQLGSFAQNAGANEANAYFQQAAQTQPLDLLGDLRRKEIADAQGRADRAADRNFIIGIGGLVVGLASRSSAPSYNPGGDTTGAQSSSLEYGGGGGGAGGSTRVMDNGESPTSGNLAMSSTLESGQTTGGVYGSTIGGPQPASTGPTAAGSQKSLQMQQTSGVAPAQPAPEAQPTQQAPMQPQQQPQPSGPSSSSPAPAAMPAAPGAPAQGMPAAAPGSTGDFSPTAFAAAASMSPSLASNPLGLAYINNYVADLYEKDPFFQSLGFIINRRWATRMSA